MRSDAAAINKGITQAVEAGRLSPSDAAAHRVTLRRARSMLSLLPGTRARVLRAVIHDVALQWRRYNRPRALALFSMLEANADFVGVNNVPALGTDIVAGDGVVYRLFSGHGFQFHPLGNFAALNEHVSRGRDAEAATLAASLAARGVPRGSGRVWEYYFLFGGGHPPWTSGMAQAVGAQALARAGARLGDAAVTRAAAAAYRTVPERFLMRLLAGPWIRIYSFNNLVVLNAQLQSVISVWDYARLSGDAGAQGVGNGMEAAAQSLFPRFDTGYWSRYSLGRDSPLGYHTYVVSLLRSLARRTADPFWVDRAARFQRYLEEPPLFKLMRSVPVLYPVPAEGFRDTAAIRVWVSKPSTVTLTVGGDRLVRAVGGGVHSFVWRPGRIPAGSYPVHLTAVDLAGNRADGEVTTIEVKRDREPPEVTATLTGRRLTWKATDEATPWLRLAVALQRSDGRKTLPLGERPLSGSLRLPALDLRWEATLVAADSSGNRARVPLGPLGGRG